MVELLFKVIGTVSIIYPDVTFSFWNLVLKLRTFKSASE